MKNEAQVYVGTLETVSNPNRAELVQYIRRGAAARRFGSVSRVYPVRGGWAVTVRRLRPDPPRWQRPVLIVGGAVSVAALACAGAALAVSSLLKEVGKVSMASVVGVVVVLVLAALIVKGSKPRVSVKVDVR